jgi:hypothetical protein
MTQGLLTAEHLRRRLHAGAALATRGHLQIEVRPQSLGPTAEPPRNWRMRLKTQLVETLLPRLKLTSYNSLIRSQARLARCIQERDSLAAHVARLTAELDAAVQERDELHEDYQRQIRALRTERRQLLERFRVSPGSDLPNGQSVP